MHDALTLQVTPAVVARFLAGLIAALVAAHVVVAYVHFHVVELDWLWRSLFDLDEEESFGTWFSTGQLALASLIVMLHAHRLTHSSNGASANGGHLHWWVLGIGFLVLSADEVAGMHESFNTATDISWTIPAALLVTVVGLLFIPFLLRLDARTRVLFALSGTIYLGGAIGVEYLTEPLLEDDMLDTFFYFLTTALEEGMEMFGVALFIYALLRHMRDQAGFTRLQIELRTTD